MKKPTIFIYQSSHSGYMACLQDLPKMGIPREDFRMVNDDTDGPAWLIRGTRQLFVTGTIHGDESGAIKMVNELKTQNPELKAASFSVYAMGGPFDHHVSKGRGEEFCKALAELMKKFITDEI